MRSFFQTKYLIAILCLLFAGNILIRYAEDVKTNQDIRDIPLLLVTRQHTVKFLDDVTPVYDVNLIKHNDVTGKQIVSEKCKLILNGDIDGIKKLKIRANFSSNEFPWRDVTTDNDVINTTADCAKFRKTYRFPTTLRRNLNVSDEEKDFPIAYSILAHENPHQIVLLLSAIYREHNIHCIHLDIKATPEVYQAVASAAKCFPNVFLSTERYDVVYASASRLLADIACMRDLLKIPRTLYDWKYHINLCSQDFPLRTNKEIVQQLKTFKGFNSIGGYSVISEQIQARTQFVYKLENVTENGVTQRKIKKTEEPHSPPPYNLTVVKNLAYNFYTRNFLQWALLDSKVGPALLNWSMDTYSPDEHYWLMLHTYPGAPGGTNLTSGYQIARQIKWWFTNPEDSCHGQWKHYICIFGAEDIHNLTRSRNLFVNKLDVTVDSTGVECLRQWLDERTFLPNQLRQDSNPDIISAKPPDSFYL